MSRQTKRQGRVRDKRKKKLVMPVCYVCLWSGWFRQVNKKREIVSSRSTAIIGLQSITHLGSKQKQNSFSEIEETVWIRGAVCPVLHVTWKTGRRSVYRWKKCVHVTYITTCTRINWGEQLISHEPVYSIFLKVDCMHALLITTFLNNFWSFFCLFVVFYFPVICFFLDSDCHRLVTRPVLYVLYE